jgi:hypothetical protein
MRIIGSFNNGAVGTALGQANGIQALGRSRQVIALCGDGGVNMLMGEFMTAVDDRRVSHGAARFRRPVREQDLGISVDGQAIQSIDNLKTIEARIKHAVSQNRHQPRCIARTNPSCE